MEEFQEAEILWPDFDREKDYDGDDEVAGGGAHRGEASAPALEIPASRPRAVRSWPTGFNRDGNTPLDGGKGIVVPPHLIVDGRQRTCGADKMTFSVCVGSGRTHKGRDLSHLRDAVLRMTGFLEG